MAGNTYGSLFRITTWGESHGPGLGVVVDGCPAGLKLGEEDIQTMMDRRKPGGSVASTQRREADLVRIMSGIFKGRTTGTPIMIMLNNADAKSDAYNHLSKLYRPGHGDFSYQHKYGLRDWRGGGRASARETAARVAAGALAKALLHQHDIAVNAYTLELGGIRAKNIDLPLKSNPFCCPDLAAADQMEKLVQKVRQEGDSLGGIVEIIAKGVPAGLGEPVFDKLDAQLAGALMSIGAVKGVEIGAGFEAARLRGSENNDCLTPQGFKTNHAGGILAGISNSDDLVMRVAVKPIPSISKPQETIDIYKNPQTLTIRGRHDISAIPRINVVCEAMVSLVLADHLLRQRAAQA